MEVLFIVNPVAGRGKARKFIPIIENICKINNVDYEIRLTSAPNEGTNLAELGAKEGFKKIIAVGGDGTLNEVLNGVAGSEAALGIIPGGSGNDFIRSINKNKNIEDIIYDNIFGDIKRIDMGKCNGKYFINVGSTGIDAEVAERTVKIKKIYSGSMAYMLAVIQTIFKYRSKRIKVQIDGLTIDEKVLLAAIANGRYYGGGMLPTPDAVIDDGSFDICFAKEMPRLKILYLFPLYIKGKHKGIREISFYKGKNIRITSCEELTVNLDGEIIKNSTIDFDIIPGGIKIIVPKEV